MNGNVIGLLTTIFTTLTYWHLLMSTKSFAFALLTSTALFALGTSVAIVADSDNMPPPPKKRHHLRKLKRNCYCVSLN